MSFSEQINPDVKFGDIESHDYTKIFRIMEEKKEFCIAEVYPEGTKFRIFSSYEEMAKFIWNDWSSDLLDEFVERYTPMKSAPMILDNHIQRCYILKDYKSVWKFISVSLDFIKNRTEAISIEEEKEVTRNEKYSIVIITMFVVTVYLGIFIYLIMGEK